MSSAFKTLRNSFVLGAASLKSETTVTSPILSRSPNALRKASFFVEPLTFLLKSRGFGPNTTPPPRQRGERNEPARARPVPFCFHGFLFEPATSPTVLVQAVPLRCAAR